MAAWYREMLPPAAACPADDDEGGSVYHLFAVRVPRRDAFRAHLDVARRGHRRCTIPLPLHLQPAFRHLGHSAGDFPVAERLSAEVVSLPMHPFLDQAQVRYVAEVAPEFFPT